MEVVEGFESDGVVEASGVCVYRVDDRAEHVNVAREQEELEFFDKFGFGVGVSGEFGHEREGRGDPCGDAALLDFVAEASVVAVDLVQATVVGGSEAFFEIGECALFLRRYGDGRTTGFGAIDKAQRFGHGVEVVFDSRVGELHDGKESGKLAGAKGLLDLGNGKVVLVVAIEQALTAGVDLKADGMAARGAQRGDGGSRSGGDVTVAGVTDMHLLGEEFVSQRFGMAIGA